MVETEELNIFEDMKKIVITVGKKVRWMVNVKRIGKRPAGFSYGAECQSGWDSENGELKFFE